MTKINNSVCTRPKPNPIALAALPDALLLNVEQLTLLLGISQGKLWSMSSTGKLPKPIKIDRITRWKRSDIEKWVEGLD